MSTTKGLTLPCPHCGEENANVRLYLADASFSCVECETEFTADDVRTIIRRWAAVLAWVDQMPGEEG